MSMPLKNTHCSGCGARFELDPNDLPEFPATCRNCEMVTYVNPLPVALLLVPVQLWGFDKTGDRLVQNQLLTIERGIEPQVGKLALPGGFIELGETWQEGAVRELEEEAGITVPAENVSLFDVANGSTTVLIIGETDPIRVELEPSDSFRDFPFDQLPDFTPPLRPPTW